MQLINIGIIASPQIPLAQFGVQVTCRLCAHLVCRKLNYFQCHQLVIFFIKEVSHDVLDGGCVKERIYRHLQLPNMLLRRLDSQNRDPFLINYHTLSCSRALPPLPLLLLLLIQQIIRAVYLAHRQPHLPLLLASGTRSAPDGFDGGQGQWQGIVRFRVLEDEEVGGGEGDAVLYAEEVVAVPVFFY